MNRKIALEYLIKSKQGDVAELLKNIPNYVVNDFIDWGYLKITKDNQWKTTKRALDHHEIFYKPPTFLESIKGWFNHIFLGI